ncbi:ribosomal L1 domain-containing protein 1-like [Scleropages formosus]|uniref:Ribosomal L1 domain-containing protein 1 n=1 Tax=Scleropages formosus TaxID=113540 RepID=A0A0P7X990_SCLFO|nr:ribosomal L1 domain-containing protein 1-like [Scleropages formosus]
MAQRVKKAVQCLLAYLKSRTAGDLLLLNECQRVSLLFTLWRIPKKEKTIRVPLPHGIRTEVSEVCLFTRDEPKMTTDQTERFYKKLLTERGVKGVTEVIPFKVLKTEYKSFESKRRLLGNFDLFLSDARVRRLLPSHLGKHFYQSKKAPLSVDLLSKQLAKSLEKIIQGSTLCISKKGSCCMAHVGHSGMPADHIVENIIATVNSVAENLPQKGMSIKIIHLKSQSSAALPVYTSDLSHVSLLKEAEENTISSGAPSGKKRKKGSPAKTTDISAVPVSGEQSEEPEEPKVSGTQKVLKRKTPVKGKATSANVKLARSAKKCPKTPVQKPRRKVPKSC